MRTRRRLLLHDLKAFLQVRDELPLLRASPERDSLLRWRAILCGPPNTPWELITLQLRIDFPPAYPSAPPVVTCVTPVFHPNVDPHTGQICASVLTGREWTPRDGLMEVLITLQRAFLSNPNIGSAFNRHAAMLHGAQKPELPRPADMTTLEQQHQQDQQPHSMDAPTYWAKVYELHQQNMDTMLDHPLICHGHPQGSV